MSYLARISTRAAGHRPTVPAIRSKGLGSRQTAIIARVEETGEEDETLSPIRPLVTRQVRRQETEETVETEKVSRQKVEDEPEGQRAVAPEEVDSEAQRQTEEQGEEEIAPLRRQEDEGEEEVSPLRRQGDEGEEELAALRRQEDEGQEELAALRRQEDEGEEEVAPLRRQEMEGEPEARPARTIARQEEIPLEDTGQTAPPPAQADLEPAAQPASQELAEDREPSDLQALHRELSPGLSASTQAATAQVETPENRSGLTPLAEALAPAHPQTPDFTDGLAIPHSVHQSTGAEESRPKVVIDQLDVLIHEPASPPVRNPPRQDRERALRARYLRRL